MYYKIVISGGSCSGKTELIPKLKDYLLRCGFNVVTVPESATQLLEMGIKPNEEFQYCVALNQFFNEEMASHVAFTLDRKKDTIILYDRSFIDQFAYGERGEILKYINKALACYLNFTNDEDVNVCDLIERYDLIVHLQSNAHNKHVADGRLETQEEAIELEKKTLQANAVHTRMRYIPAQKDINTKLHLLEHVVINNIIELSNKKLD